MANTTTFVRQRCKYEEESEYFTVDKRIKLTTGYISKLSLPTCADVSMMDIKMFEDRIECLNRAGIEFTSCQQNYINKSRRMIKNREYAKASRERKNESIKELKAALELKESEMLTLREENERIRRSCGLLVATNIRLSSELELYRMIENPVMDKLECTTLHYSPQQGCDYISLDLCPLIA